MTDLEFNAGVAAIVEQIQQLNVSMARVAAALEYAIAPEETQEEAGCPHPPEMRADFGVTDGQPDFECRACGFKSLVVVTAHG